MEISPNNHSITCSNWQRHWRWDCYIIGIVNIIASLLSSLTMISIPSIGFNWIDILVLVIIIFYSIQGFSLGFLTATIDFISFALSFLLGLSLYIFVANFLVKYFSIPQGFANAIGFFAIAVLSEIIFTLIIRIFLA